MRLPALAFVLAGCTFEPPPPTQATDEPPEKPSEDGGARPDDPDAAMQMDAGRADMGVVLVAIPPTIERLPRSQRYYGDGDLILESVTIDTSVPAIDELDLPEGVTFELSGQTQPGAPIVAVLHVRNFTVLEKAVVRVIGAYPLIVVAGGDVRIRGVLDASARGAQPGAGGYASGEGPAAGRAGPSLPMLNDLGGGGGGFGTEGGRGGDIGVSAGGAPGLVAGDETLAVLEGGSGGGAGGTRACPSARGGAGGGAMHIHASAKLDVEGAIDVGGGGGEGGAYCDQTDAAAGGGGGAGGAVHLEALEVRVRGAVAANGGGGGGGGSGEGALGSGEPGEDGRIDLAALGGNPGGPRGTEGGTGSFQGAGQTGGARVLVGNTGGGGGGGGRILIRSVQPAVLEGTIVPAPHVD